eukprot:108578-Hanusia_phi.AAC.4
MMTRKKKQAVMKGVHFTLLSWGFVGFAIALECAESISTISGTQTRWLPVRRITTLSRTRCKWFSFGLTFCHSPEITCSCDLINAEIRARSTPTPYPHSSWAYTDCIAEHLTPYRSTQKYYNMLPRCSPKPDALPLAALKPASTSIGSCRKLFLSC